MKENMMGTVSYSQHMAYATGDETRYVVATGGGALVVQLRGEIEGQEGSFDLLASLQKLDEMVREAIVAEGGDPDAGIVTLTFTDLVSSPEQPFHSDDARSSAIAAKVAKELEWIVQEPS